MKSKLKRFFVFSFFTGLFMLLLLLLSDWHVSYAVRDQHSDQVESIQPARVAVVLGTIKHLQNGYINPYYQYRIDAAIDLYRSGKVSYILLSGDNGTQAYNEPLDMKKDMIAAGIPTHAIYMDFAGFRTYDSMYRVKEVFACNDPIIISQPFHNERALYIANSLGMKAQAYDADKVPLNWGLMVRIRETLARVNMRLDILRGIEPRFLGEQITIGRA